MRTNICQRKIIFVNIEGHWNIIQYTLQYFIFTPISIMPKIWWINKRKYRNTEYKARKAGAILRHFGRKPWNLYILSKVGGVSSCLAMCLTQEHFVCSISFSLVYYNGLLHWEKHLQRLTRHLHSFFFFSLNSLWVWLDTCKSWTDSCDVFTTKQFERKSSILKDNLFAFTYNWVTCIYMLLLIYTNAQAKWFTSAPVCLVHKTWTFYDSHIYTGQGMCTLQTFFQITIKFKCTVLWWKHNWKVNKIYITVYEKSYEIKLSSFSAEAAASSDWHKIRFLQS